ncbi:MAG: AIR synthase [Solirubrobacteraceae bacterium]|nr:AIR synthase [Solirubrobacteraceae bacterium]
MLRIAENPGPSIAPALVPEPEFALVVIEPGDRGALIAGYRALRREAFVVEQELFAGHDLDEFDEDPRTRVLVVVDRAQRVLGGVRIHPAVLDGPELAWWRGSRLVARPLPGVRAGEIGAHLVSGACRLAEQLGALRFDAHVQAHCEGFFGRLGWSRTGHMEIGGLPHVAMRWPVERIAALARATKSPLGGLLADGTLATGGAFAPFIGDDATPIPNSSGMVACTDAILPAMVARDPEWAGWCGMLVTAHDLSAMGAAPVAALDAVGARDEAAAARVLRGLREGAEMFDLPIVGGHTTLGVEGSLSVTGLGRTDRPVPAGGGRVGDALTLTADLAGDWRPGYGHRQWDSSTHRTREEMRPMLGAVAAAQPHAAKDVSMAGIVGTIGMLAEASGCGAELDVCAIPRPDRAQLGDWLTCFPGFAMVTADAPGAPPVRAGAAVSAACGELSSAAGVRLRWPDGEVTTVIAGGVTGLGAAARLAPATNASHGSSYDPAALAADQ